MRPFLSLPEPSTGVFSTQGPDIFTSTVDSSSQIQINLNHAWGRAELPRARWVGLRMFEPIGGTIRSTSVPRGSGRWLVPGRGRTAHSRHASEDPGRGEPWCRDRSHHRMPLRSSGSWGGSTQISRCSARPGLGGHTAFRSQAAAKRSSVIVNRSIPWRAWTRVFRKRDRPRTRTPTSHRFKVSTDRSGPPARTWNGPPTSFA